MRMLPASDRRARAEIRCGCRYAPRSRARRSCAARSSLASRKNSRYFRPNVDRSFAATASGVRRCTSSGMSEASAVLITLCSGTPNRLTMSRREVSDTVATTSAVSAQRFAKRKKKSWSSVVAKGRRSGIRSWIVQIVLALRTWIGSAQVRCAISTGRGGSMEKKRPRRRKSSSDRWKTSCIVRISSKYPIRSRSVSSWTADRSPASIGSSLRRNPSSEDQTAASLRAE